MFCFAFRNQLFHFITTFLTCQALFYFYFYFSLFLFRNNDLYIITSSFCLSSTFSLFFFIFLFQTFFELVCSLERSIRISSSTETVNRFFHFFLFFCNFGDSYSNLNYFLCIQKCVQTLLNSAFTLDLLSFDIIYYTTKRRKIKGFFHIFRLFQQYAQFPFSPSHPLPAYHVNGILCKDSFSSSSL